MMQNSNNISSLLNAIDDNRQSKLQTFRTLMSPIENAPIIEM